MTRLPHPSSLAAVAAVCACLLAGCGGAERLSATDGRVKAVTTSGLLRDIVANVGGSRVAAVSVMPDGADPHTFEPSLRAAREVVDADLAFRNGLMLEHSSLVKTLVANLGDGVPNVALAEEASKYSASTIPLRGGSDHADHADHGSDHGSGHDSDHGSDHGSGHDSDHGEHAPGEVDPHLWHDARNVIAYAKVVRDRLIAVDPDGTAFYRARAGTYIRRLEKLDAHMRRTLSAIPRERRKLITTHNAFAYLADAYDVEIAGFVMPSAAGEPSLLDRRELAETIRALRTRAIFLEPNLKTRSPLLEEIAAAESVRVCPLYGDVLDERVSTYIELMRFNASSLRRCLT